MKTPPPNPTWSRRLVLVVCAFGAGAIAGVGAHYVIYRLSLPSAPFIYVAF